MKIILYKRPRCGYWSLSESITDNLDVLIFLKQITVIGKYGNIGLQVLAKFDKLGRIGIVSFVSPCPFHDFTTFTPGCWGLEKGSDSDFIS